jgi:hypothetical protein
MKLAFRSLSIAIVTAFAVLALSAATATADTVEVTSEVDSAHCDIEALNCRFFAGSEGETEVWAHFLAVQILISKCADQFEGVIGEDGEGSIYTYGTLPSAGCTRENCSGAEGVWPTHLRETGANQERLAVRLCLADLMGQNPRHCDIELEAETTHESIEAFADETPCTNTANPKLEISGHWVTQLDGDHPPLEVTHQ